MLQMPPAITIQLPEMLEHESIVDKLGNPIWPTGHPSQAGGGVVAAEPSKQVGAAAAAHSVHQGQGQGQPAEKCHPAASVAEEEQV